MAVPIRTCVGCRVRGESSALVRVAWDTPSQGLVVDVRRRLPGRGAWLHLDGSCLDQATRRKAWGRALRRTVEPQHVNVLTSQLDALLGAEPVGSSGAQAPRLV